MKPIFLTIAVLVLVSCSTNFRSDVGTLDRRDWEAHITKQIGPLVQITAVVLREEQNEVHYWLDGQPGHDTVWYSVMDLQIEQPREYASRNRRLIVEVPGLVSYAEYIGKRVRIAMPLIVMQDDEMRAGIGWIWIEEDQNQSL